MSSNTGPEVRWSLTRRLALLFAGATCALMLVQATFSAWYVFRVIRSDTQHLIEHELTEVMMEIIAEPDAAAWPRVMQQGVEVFSEDEVCALRLRREGVVIAEAGPAHLLEAVPEPIMPRMSWQKWLFDRHVTVGALRHDPGMLRLEMIMDGEPTVEALLDYAAYAGVSLVVTFVLAGLGGWFVARRGLSGLRAVVRQAAAIDPLRHAGQVRVSGAPEEVRAVGAALNGLLDRIQDSTEQMRTFTAGLAHELRSPLMNLIGETEVALMQRREPPEYEALLRSHLDEMHELSDAVGNLVAYCRSTEPRGLTPQVEHFDLSEESSIRLERERRRAEREGIGLSFSSHGDTTLRADRESYLRVLRNLVGNALDWTPPGRNVDVRIEGRKEWVSLVVEDEGPGVPASMSRRIFEPFVSGRARQGRRSGYGLGLAICRSILVAHNGTMHHDARPGGGSRFEARFPRRSIADMPDPRARRRDRLLQSAGRGAE